MWEIIVVAIARIPVVIALNRETVDFPPVVVDVVDVVVLSPMNKSYENFRSRKT